MMGCGCGRNKRKKQKSSRMPKTDTIQTLNGIKIPTEMSPDQRRSAIAKIKNGRINSTRKKTVAEQVKERKSREG